MSTKHRAFNSSYIDGNSFIKLSHEDRLHDEISFYKRIKDFPQKNLFANFLGDLSNGLTYALKLQNYPNCSNLFEIFLNSDEASSKLLINQLIWRMQLLHTYPAEEVSDKCNISLDILNQKMLIHKTETEWNALTSKPVFVNLCKSDTLVINGETFQNFQNIWSRIKQIITERYLNFNLSLVHGDFCLANILSDSTGQTMVFVDPRGSYGLKGCFGDSAYDLAKLIHSISGNYEQIIYDMFELQYSPGIVEFRHERDFEFLMPLLEKAFSKEAIQKARLIEGLIFIGMCARHYDSHDRQVVMYATGISKLNKWLENYENLF